METVKWLMERFGLPTAFLAVVCWAAWKMLSKKDAIIDQKDLRYAAQEEKHKGELGAKSEAYALLMSEKDSEIKRLNDARLADSQTHGERMLTAATESLELVGETNTTLTMLATQIKAWREDARN